MVPDADTRLWIACKHSSSETMSSRWSRLTPPHVCTLLSQELQAPGNSEARNISSLTFFKTTWHVEAAGHLDYFAQAVWRHFMFLFHIFYV